MTERTAQQITRMKEQTIGVEVEMNHIKRSAAAKIAADFFGTGRYENTARRNGYETYSAWDAQGREWKFQKDVSIAGIDSEKCELVTPILHYDDIETLQELIRRLKRAEFARLRVEIFKPRIDVRYSEEEVVSHDASAIRSTPVDSAQNILLMTSDVDVVGIDEAQFFDQGLVEVCRQLADSGVRVIVAGLDMDFTGKPFGPMPALMATAEYVTKVHAICVRCGNLAHHSHRLTSDEKQVMLGAQDSYEPICRHCFAELRKKERE